MSESKELTRRILQSSDWGVTANDILSEFHRGRPVEQLRPLLQSREPLIVRAASFITSELGSKASPLLESVAGLLHHAEARVRSDAIISLITCTTAKHQKEIASVISMLDDTDWRIRHEVMEFISRVSRDQLLAASQHFARLDASSGHAAGLKWLLSEGGCDLSQINAWVGSDIPLSRKYGVVAATRLASVNLQALRSATSSPDEDIQRFADSMLQMRGATNPPHARSKLKRRQYGLLCPRCTAVLSTPDAKTNVIVCHHCGEDIELI